MHRIDGDDVAVALPTPQGAGTAGYFAAEGVLPATQVTGDWLNAVQEELIALLTLIGGTPDKTAQNQIATRIAKHLLAQVGASSGSLTTDPSYNRTNIASGGCTASGAKSANIASVDSLAKSALSANLASDGCTVGNLSGAVECAAVASLDSTVTGDQSAAIAADTVEVTGQQAAAVAFQGGAGDGVSGAQSAAIASQGDGGGGFLIAGQTSAGVASFDTTIDAGSNLSASLASDTAAMVGVSCTAAVATQGCEFATNCDSSGAFAAKNIKINAAQAAAIAATGDTATDEVTGTNGLIAATVDSKVAGAQAAVLGGSLNEANKTGSAVIASAYSKTVIGGQNFVAVLASRGYESDVGTDAPAYSVAGGYDAGTPPTPAGRAWAIESNGGNMRSTNAHTTSGLDYAEWFPNGDADAHAPGRILTRRGRSAHLAGPGDRILGVVSVAPTVIGGDDTLGWQGRWERDEWGAYVLHEVDEVNHQRDVDAERAQSQRQAELRAAVLEAGAQRRAAAVALQLARLARADLDRPGADAESIAVADGAVADAAASLAAAVARHVDTRAAAEAELAAMVPPPRIETTTRVLTRKVNPAFDARRKHTPRSARSADHTCVGLLGQLRVAVDASVSADDDVVAGKDGIGTRWDAPVLERESRPGFDAKRRGAQLECMEITSPFDEARGYAIALCLLR